MAHGPFPAILVVDTGPVVLAEIVSVVVAGVGLVVDEVTAWVVLVVVVVVPPATD